MRLFERIRVGVETSRVIVADRWYHSTAIEAEVVDDDAYCAALRMLADAESNIHAHVPAILFALDALDATLDDRMHARGEVPTPTDRERRRQYRSHPMFATATVVNTDRHVNEVTDDIVELIMRKVRL